MDIDSILYIVITLAILIISGLSGRKRKQAQMEAAKAKATPSADSQEGGSYMQEEESDEIQEISDPASDTPVNLFKTFKQSQNPLERLEQILTGQVPLENQVPPPYKSAEGVTMEDTVDEEEQILADIRKRNEEVSDIETEDLSGTTTGDTEEEDARSLPGLFADIDEIKKAVIYSEILNRKY
jgi:hypothetical protein